MQSDDYSFQNVSEGKKMLIFLEERISPLIIGDLTLSSQLRVIKYLTSQSDSIASKR